MAKRKLRVAIVHDWLYGGGAERVVYELHKMYPDAPIFTSYCSSEWRTKLDGKVVTGFLQHWPFSKLRKILPVLRIWWFTHLDFSDYDLVLSSCGNGEAKGIKVPKDTVHISYIHTPTHFYWRHYNTYLQNPGFGFFNPLARLGLKLLVSPLRKWDYKAAQRPTHIVANSHHIKADIKKYYGRESTVIYPPVDIKRFAVPSQKRSGFVTASRQVPAKHINIIVEACTKINVPLTVIGRGPEHNKLRKIAGPNVTFLEHVSDIEIAKYFGAAEAFLFASYEDFGVTPVEAMAAGTPVIAYKAGGALDYVKESKTGLFFEKQDCSSLISALQKLASKNFNHNYICKAAEQFSIEHFTHHMQEFIKKHS